MKKKLPRIEKDVYGAMFSRPYPYTVTTTVYGSADSPGIHVLVKDAPEYSEDCMRLTLDGIMQGETATVPIPSSGMVNFYRSE